MMLQYLLDDESKVVTSQIIIKDTAFPGVPLSGHKCGLLVYFSTEIVITNLFS